MNLLEGRTAEPLRRMAKIETVYGTPLQVEGRTIMTVSRVAYGWGRAGDLEEEGGGGGGMAEPVGVVEITRRGTRFVPIARPRRDLWLMAMGLVLGAWIARR